MQPTHAAIILAAGLSSRMGRFKPLLPLGDAPAIARVIGVYRDAGVADVRVVLGHRAEELLPLLESWGARAVLNHDFQQGMFSSVKAGVASLEAWVDAFFIHPVDIPLVNRATLHALLRARQEGRPRVIYPTFQGRRGHPPLISGELAAGLLAWSGEQGLRGFLRQYQDQVLELAVPDEFILRDMDHPEDYAALAGSLAQSPATRRDPGDL